VKIDVFAHIQPPAYSARLQELLWRSRNKRVEEYNVMLVEDPTLVDLDARWRSMDRFEDYRQVLVLGAPPLEELGDPESVADLARAANDELAELVARYPDRFVGFAAALPLSSVDLSLEEIDRVIGAGMGALGVQIYTNVCGRPLDSPEFEPLFARMEELDRAIWLHPARSLHWSDYPHGGEDESRYDIYWSLGWPYETAVAMARLVYSGVMERHPRLKIITHHGGGLVPHLRGRLTFLPWGKDGDVVRERLPRHPLDYHKRFYGDTAMMSAGHAVRCTIEFFGIDHVLFGSDFGFGPHFLHETINDIGSLDLDEESAGKLYEGNARRVLRLPESVA
jgi:uncharacterized protein